MIKSTTTWRNINKADTGLETVLKNDVLNKRGCRGGEEGVRGLRKRTQHKGFKPHPRRHGQPPQEGLGASSLPP